MIYNDDGSMVVFYAAKDKFECSLVDTPQEAMLLARRFLKRFG